MDHAKPGLVKILKPGGVAGNGFLVGERLIATCAHVVAEALHPDCAKDQDARPQGEVEVEFTFCEDRAPRRATVIETGWFPAVDRPDGRFDVALLRLANAQPHDARPLRLADGTRDDLRVRLQPHLPALGRSQPVCAVTRGCTEYREVGVVAVDDYLQWIEPGVSGTPVFAEDDGHEVVGMVVWRDAGPPRQAFMKPADVLRVCLPAPDRAEAGDRLWLEVDEERRRYADPDLLGFDVFAPSQAARPGAGVEVHFEASFDRFSPEGPKFREVWLELSAPSAPSDRFGFAEAVEIRGVRIKALGDRGHPRWRMEAIDGVLSDTNLQVDAPPLCVLGEATAGDEVRSRMVVYANRSDAVVIPDEVPDAEDQGAAKARIIERLRLKDIGDPDNDGRVVLGAVVSVVKEAP